MNIPGSLNKIQQEEVAFLAAISKSTMKRIGAAINYLLAAGVIYPVGTVKKAFLTEAQFQLQMGPTWVLCDGRDVTGSDYAATFGSNFIPDARGTFLRMKDNGAGIDQNGDLPLGSYEHDNVEYHTHNYNVSYDDTVTSAGIQIRNGNDSIAYEALPDSAQPLVTNLSIPNAGALDTRPKNLTANQFIKINLVSA